MWYLQRPGPGKEPAPQDSSPGVFGEWRQGRPLGRCVVVSMCRQPKLWQGVYGPLAGVPSLSQSLGIGLGFGPRLSLRVLVPALVLIPVLMLSSKY